jgi:hypothetical protein
LGIDPIPEGKRTIPRGKIIFPEGKMFLPDLKSSKTPEKRWIPMEMPQP